MRLDDAKNQAVACAFVHQNLFNKAYSPPKGLFYEASWEWE